MFQQSWSDGALKALEAVQIRSYRKSNKQIKLRTMGDLP